MSRHLLVSARRRAVYGSARVAVVLGLLLAAVLPRPAVAQDAPATGRIAGRVIDAESGQGVAGVGVQVVGGTLGAMTGVDGSYTIPNVPAGTVTLQLRRIGYAPKTVTGLIVPAGGGIEQNITMSAANLELTAVTVSAAAERGSVNSALDAQRTATGIVNAITAEQISKSPDGDAAKAIQRVSGVTVQDGKSVFVRGLGERYTVTNLNGTRLPSPEPEKRYVPLDMFPSGLLQSINVSKTFTPDLSGDFSGASVDIQTREFPARRAVTFSASLGANQLATGQPIQAAPSTGSEWFGFGASDRPLPSGLATANAVSGLTTRPQINGAINSLRNAWTPLEQTGLPNGSFGVSVGGQDPLFGLRIGYLASLTYSASQSIREDDYQANPEQRDGGIAVLESWAGQGSSRGVSWGGMFNLSSLITQNTRLSLNNTYTRSADSDARRTSGASFAFSLANVERQTLRYVERAIRSTQLKGEHTLGSRQNLDWSVSTAGVLRQEPDRSDLVYAQFGAGQPFAWSDGNPDVARRTFGDLSENNWTYSGNYKLALTNGVDQAFVKLGGTYRTTQRDAVNRQFSIISTFVPTDARELPAEALFDGRFTSGDDAIFNILNVAQDGVYNASEQVAAGYVMAEIPFGERIKLIGGARVENASIDVNTVLTNATVFNSGLNNTDVLPALVLNIKTSPTSQFRASASQTLARPEYRELSPVQYLEVVGGQITRGNPDLVRTLIQSYDVKYEMFPNAGEVLSIGVFAKRFDKPIERIDIATGGQPFVSFFNAKSANNLGVEIEARKGLGGLAEALSPLSVFSNVTLMQSDIEVGGDASSNTNANRPMMGQAPWVVNAGATYTGRSNGTSATLLYSAVGARIYSAGTIPFPDVYEQPRHLVDLSLRMPLGDRWTWRMDARNLLDAPYKLTQGPITRESYRMGREIALGMQWRR
jgi:outer membrane receptor for ferrienterochelin and colicin